MLRQKQFLLGSLSTSDQKALSLYYTTSYDIDGEMLKRILVKIYNRTQPFLRTKKHQSAFVLPQKDSVFFSFLRNENTPFKINLVFPYHANTFYGHFRDFDSGEYHHRFRRGAAESKPNMKLDKRPARKSPLGASWGLRCSQIYILFSRALVTSWSSKPQWKEKTKIFTLCLSLMQVFLIPQNHQTIFVAKQMTKGFP